MKSVSTIALLLIVMSQCEGQHGSVFTALHYGNRPLLPDCSSILNNLTSGTWVPRTSTSYRSSGSSSLEQFTNEIANERARLDNERITFWQRKGYPTNNYQSTNYCGHYRYQRVTRDGHKIGRWCDADGGRPCCANNYWGRCMPPLRAFCTCPSCVDSRKYDYAALREWQPRDHRCLWHKYSSDEACDVIEASQYDKIYYVGDSFTADMWATLLMMLTDKPIVGAWNKNMTPEQRYFCSDSAFTNWMPCRKLTYSFDDMLYRDDVCSGRNISFRGFYRSLYNVKRAQQFHDLVNDNLGREGTLIVVSVGFHMGFRSDLVIFNYLEPAIALIRNHYRSQPQGTKRWPQILYSLPMRNGLLKNTDQLRLQPPRALVALEVAVRGYCRRNNIDVLDFQELGDNVHSYDGVHYDMDVNRMKNQILFNYIASQLDR